MRRAQPERALHNAVAAFLRAALPGDVAWTTVGHGGGGKVRGAQLKAAGVMPGWPDLQVLIPYGGHGRLLGIELKAARGRLSPEQIDCHQRIERAGGEAIVCRSVEEVETALRIRGVALKASVGKGGLCNAA